MAIQNVQHTCTGFPERKCTPHVKDIDCFWSQPPGIPTTFTLPPRISQLIGGGYGLFLEKSNHYRQSLKQKTIGSHIAIKRTDNNITVLLHLSCIQILNKKKTFKKSPF